MARIQNLKLTPDDVSQEIDLKKSLGIDISNNGPMKEAVGQWIIDRILERTSKGVDAYGKPFKKYSKDYEQSLEFRAFKSSHTVNMELKGDMLASIDILSKSGNTLKIGFKDAEQATKAYGHMTGMKGNKMLEGVTPVRTFFGLSDDDIAAMRKEFSPDITNKSEDEAKHDSILMKLLTKAGSLFSESGGTSDGSGSEN
jgi:hypothetical protein